MLRGDLKMSGKTLHHTVITRSFCRLDITTISNMISFYFDMNIIIILSNDVMKNCMLGSLYNFR